MKSNLNPLFVLQESHSSRVKRYGEELAKDLEDKTRKYLTIKKFNKADKLVRNGDDLFSYADRVIKANKGNNDMNNMIKKHIRIARNKRNVAKNVGKFLLKK